MLNGPMDIQKLSDDDWELNLKHTGSWADFANMVYVDQPIDTGFSWSSDGSVP